MENLKSSVVFDPKSKDWFNQTPVNEKFKTFNLGEIILNKLNEFPADKVIEINATTGTQTTSIEMKNLVIQIAIQLQKMNIQQSDTVVLFCSMTQLTTPLIYACLLIGAIYVIFDTLFSDDTIKYMLEVVEPSLIVYGIEYHERLTQIMSDISLPKLKSFLSFEEKDDKNSLRQRMKDRRNSSDDFDNFKIPYLGNPQENIATFLFTSGTSGRPKLVAHSHSFLAFGIYYSWDLSESSILYVANPLRSVSQNASIFHPILFNCSRIYATVLNTPEFCARTIKKYKVTHFLATGTLIKNILSFVSEKKGTFLITLKVIFTGGERTAKTLSSTLKNLNINCVLGQLYGMAETAGFIGRSFEGINKKFGYTIVPGIRVRIMDPDDGTLLMQNQNGIICIKGQTEFGLYWKNKKANQTSFIEDEWFITGDYGKVGENNELFLYNRYKDLIRCEEKVVIPSLLEATLEDHPLLENCYIISIPQDRYVGSESPVAFCKLNQSKLEKSKLSLEQAKEDIKEYINLRIGSNQVPPSDIYLLDEVPFTSGGKVDRQALRSSIVDRIFELE